MAVGLTSLKRKDFGDCLNVGRVSDSQTGWGRKFQRMGDAREKSCRRAWEDMARELDDSRRFWKEHRPVRGLRSHWV